MQMMSKSETPRTDEVYAAAWVLPAGDFCEIPDGHPPCDPWVLCRQLERELAAAQAALKEAQERAEEAEEECDRYRRRLSAMFPLFEEAHDALADILVNRMDRPEKRSES